MTTEGTAPLYLEHQRLGWGWMRAVLLLLAALYAAAVVQDVVALTQGDGLGRVAPALLHLLMVPLFLCWALLRHEIRVHPDALELRVRPLPMRRTRRIPLAAIRHVELGSVYPGLDEGAWGVGAGGRGVRIEIRDGAPLWVASARPEALKAAIEAAHAPGTRAAATA